MNRDLNELKRLAAELGEEIKRLEETPKPIPTPKPWPQVWDRAFVLNPVGDIVEYLATPHKIAFISATIVQGSGFRTRAEAEAEKHYREIANELSQQAGARKFVVHEKNYGLGFDAEDKKLNISCSRVFTGSHLNAYYGTDEQCRKAIAAVGEQEIIRAIRWKELGETL